MDVSTYYLELMFIFAEKKRSTRKKPDCTFIRINTSKDGYDANYEICKIKLFIKKSKKRKLRKL